MARRTAAEALHELLAKARETGTPLSDADAERLANIQRTIEDFLSCYEQNSKNTEENKT